MSKDLTEALAALTQTDPYTLAPDPAQARGGKPAQKAAAKNSGGAGSGVFGSLTETSFSAREYYSAGWKTSDGIFVMPAIKSAQFLDAGGNVIPIGFKEPA